MLRRNDSVGELFGQNHFKTLHVITITVRYRRVCSRMLTYAHVCSRMLTYALSLSLQSPSGSISPIELSSENETRRERDKKAHSTKRRQALEAAGVTAYADVC
jgi:hypothetical protein